MRSRLRTGSIREVEAIIEKKIPETPATAGSREFIKYNKKGIA
jgi:hypothetical protein